MDGQTDGQSENYRALASKQEINIHSVFMFFFFVITFQVQVIYYNDCVCSSNCGTTNCTVTSSSEYTNNIMYITTIVKSLL